MHHIQHNSKIEKSKVRIFDYLYYQFISSNQSYKCCIMKKWYMKHNLLYMLYILYHYFCNIQHYKLNIWYHQGMLHNWLSIESKVYMILGYFHLYMNLKDMSIYILNHYFINNKCFDIMYKQLNLSIHHN